MTVNTEVSAIVYPATGATDTFPYTWQIAQDSDLVVYQMDSTGATITLKTLTTDYTVTGAGVPTGGNVVLTAGNPTAGSRVFICSDPEQIQSLLLQLGAASDPADLMHALDLLTREVQANRRLVDGALQIPVAEAEDGHVMVLPPAPSRALMVAGFDAAGDVTVFPQSASSSPISPSLMIQTVNTIAALKALTTPATAEVYAVRGYYATGDGGGGLFVYNSASVASDNLGTIIAPNAGTGRWQRLFSGRLESKWFGAKHDGVTNDSAAFQAMATTGLDCRSSVGGTVVMTTGIELTTAFQKCDLGGAKIVSLGSSLLLHAVGAVFENVWYEGSNSLPNGVFVIGSSTDSTKTSHVWEITNPRVLASGALYGVVVANGSYSGNIRGGIIQGNNSVPVANSCGLFLGDQVTNVNVYGTHFIAWATQAEARGVDAVNFFGPDVGDGASTGNFLYINAIPAGGDPSPFGNNVYPNGEGSWWGSPTQTVGNLGIYGWYSELVDIAIYVKTGLTLTGMVVQNCLFSINNSSPNVTVGTRVFKCDVPHGGVVFTANRGRLADYVFEINTNFVTGLVSLANSWEDCGRGTAHVGVLAVGTGAERLMIMEADSVSGGFAMSCSRGFRLGTDADKSGTNRYASKKLTGCDMNAATTDAIPTNNGGVAAIAMPSKYRLRAFACYDASINLNTATIQLRDGSGGGGSNYLATASLAACTAASKVASFAFTGAALTDYQTGSLYVRCLAAQGAPATLTAFIEYEDLS